MSRIALPDAYKFHHIVKFCNGGIFKPIREVVRSSPHGPIRVWKMANLTTWRNSTKHLYPRKLLTTLAQRVKQITRLNHAASCLFYRLLLSESVLASSSLLRWRWTLEW